MICQILFDTVDFIKIIILTLGYASRILSRCKRRIQQDWLDYFGYPLLLLETFVDPERYQGTIYRASNWILVGPTKGYRRIRTGYSERTQSIKWVFILPLQRNARTLLSRPYSMAVTKQEKRE